MASPPASRLPEIRVASCILTEHGATLGPVGIALYTALKLYANRTTQQCFPKITTLATLIGVSPRTVEQHLPTLYRLGLVKVRPRYLSATKRSSNVYTLIDPTDTAAVLAHRAAYAQKSRQNPREAPRPSPSTPKPSSEETGPLRGSETPETPTTTSESPPPATAPVPASPSIAADSACRSIAANAAWSISIAADSAVKLVPTSLTSQRATPGTRRRSLAEPPSPTPPARGEVPPAPELCLVDPTHGPLTAGHYCRRCIAECLRDPKPGPAASRSRRPMPPGTYPSAAD